MPEIAPSTSPPLTTNNEPSNVQGFARQTSMVGDEIYLRPLNAEDAATGTSWRQTPFPYSTSRVESWMEENLAKEDPSKKETLGILRKADDMVVGSVTIDHDPPETVAQAHVDPLYGDAGLAWKGEALVLVARWIVDERHGLIVHVDIPANETPVIAALEGAGFRQTCRFRAKRFMNGAWIDELIYDYVNSKWVQTLGDPMAIPLPHSGTGEPRPVPPQVIVNDDPPRGALMIGERVYLRAFEKKDADDTMIWAMRESESDFSLGRGAYSAAATTRDLLAQQKEALPENISFIVCLRETDETIGLVDLMDIDYINRNAETASWFHRPEYRGGGYGSEAKHLLLEYAFNHLRLHMVHSWVLFQNTRSAAALRKQGYREAGQANWLFTHRGGLGNMVLFDLLADEWRALPRAARAS